MLQSQKQHPAQKQEMALATQQQQQQHSIPQGTAPPGTLLDGLVNPARTQAFADYADRHELFALLEGLVGGVLQERPEDPLAHMVAALKVVRAPGIAVLAPPMHPSDAVTAVVGLLPGCVCRTE